MPKFIRGGKAVNMDWFEFFVISLASFRLTRLIVFDKITAILRAPFLTEEVEVNENGEKETYYVPRNGVLRNFFGELVSCIWCTGVWSTGALYLSYVFWPAYASPFIIILAIAGAAAIIEITIQQFIEE